MHVVTTRAELDRARTELLADGQELSLVPTMGYLHEGHLSLVRAAQRDGGAVAVSIFVNPKQFGEGEDLATYPRDLDRDLALLRDAGVDLVWTPGDEDVYPPGSATSVEIHGVTEVLEGERRPGHFAGVATVCTILFNVVRPHRAYFGQKDAQQTVVVRRFVRDLALPVDVRVEPIVREADGLARSSRNVYLTPEQRSQAVVLSRAVRAVEQVWRDGGRDADELRALVRDLVQREAPAGELDYVSVADPDTLAELDTLPGTGALVSMVVRFGRTRLLDNTILQP
ncbi:pantoate--beta-alanine ligase [Arsenicicoccus dermatophilus]|uniref:pantoate--beta-alanine ligase n=1 Tax=Arsenicicoccus dermatophilus TaxID=1076331 RepID=UPI001F4C65AC|nr:pantoate--beta-alanine ligase [Arsenicicoccus dermatophilus]MCH8614234.1 pantoate--beta-alanine ligase [Arsenicicoccus dermatophilus]